MRIALVFQVPLTYAFDRRTRTSTPISRFVNDDDQNMTSGDESDNEDLTDASSDSDWSDMACEFPLPFKHNIDTKG